MLLKYVLYLQDPHEAVVQVRINRLHVVQGDGFTQQLFVKGQSKASVYVVAVEHRHPHDTAHEVKIRQVFLRTDKTSLVSKLRDGRE